MKKDNRKLHNPANCCEMFHACAGVAVLWESMLLEISSPHQVVCGLLFYEILAPVYGSRPSLTTFSFLATLVLFPWTWITCLKISAKSLHAG